MGDVVLVHQLCRPREGIVAPDGDERRDRAVPGGALVDVAAGGSNQVEVGDETPTLNGGFRVVVEYVNGVDVLLGHDPRPLLGAVYPGCS